MLHLDGERHRLGGPEKARGDEGDRDAGRCDFLLPGGDVTVSGRVESDRKNFVGWVYADPDGPEHNTINCSIADMTLTVSADGQPDRELRAEGRGRLRARDARDGPRHPAAAVPRRLAPRASCSRLLA